MTLYFQDRYGDLREIAQVSGEAAAMEQIRAFCDERNMLAVILNIFSSTEQHHSQ